MAIVILGMHRSGTSCLAGMLAAGGIASAGQAVRNWDNARGHHEMLDMVRLDEAVLAYSGGHWLAAPREVRWTEEHEAARDRLLAARIDGRAALLKDPRSLIVLPFWRASSVPFHAIGIVRHPLAVARSLESWRGMPLAEGVALWTVHNRALLADRARYDYALIDFDAPRQVVVDQVMAACRVLAVAFDAGALAAAYEDQLVHHDTDGAPEVPGLEEALAVYQSLVGHAGGAARRAFPRVQLAEVERQLRAGEPPIDAARSALAAVTDASAVLVPLVTSLARHRAYDLARTLIAETASRLDPGMADLLLGKLALAAHDADAAVRRLEAACAVSAPFYQARHLLPQALRAAGRHAEARAALERVAGEALYPHGPLATLAEWAWLDGDRSTALAHMARAITTAPPHRRGRLRTRLAEWLVEQGDTERARAELEHAIAEDPGYGRSREVLASLQVR